ncbi:zinc-ribbon domain-containing protein [Tropicimonas sp. IMCC34011]|uniref:zinc-ribbon domain-containing protein n=1 Tax=Tropicimonas sp. IMCC34011 TaxID=2248759 RepID=UPI0018E577B6|nr:zinc-ribbon domain-containing protein [Tropicimonas sp. IMCC34011]
MRLICPNCGAQYVVDDAAVPDEGRDVQCSSCGHSWFQLHPSRDRGLAEELGEAIREPETPEPATPDAPPDAEPEPEGYTSEYDDEDDLPPVQPERPRRREIDPKVLAVLREEAAREQAARRAEAAAPLEMQDEFAMDPPEIVRAPEPDPEPEVEPASQPDPFSEPEPSPDQPAGTPPDPEPPLERPDDEVRARRVAPRRTLLPDIEEINTALDPADSGRAVGEEAEEAARSDRALRRARSARGRRIGLAIAIVIFGLALMTYLEAPRIAMTAPALEEPVAAYVARIDEARLWLDDTLRSVAGAD